MVLSKACTYGLLASLYVAKENGIGYVSIKEMSKNLNISFHFLTKILQILTANKIMISHKGPKGGVSLGKPPDSISLLDIIIAIDGPDVFTECVLGLPGCGHKKPCPVHHLWANVREEVRQMFSSKTLSNTTEDVIELGLRLRLE